MSDGWTAVIGTAVGGAIGFGSALFLEARRSRQARDAELYREQVLVISDFAALAHEAYTGVFQTDVQQARQAKLAAIGSRANIAFGSLLLAAKMALVLEALHAASRKNGNRHAVNVARTIADYDELMKTLTTDAAAVRARLKAPASAVAIQLSADEIR